MVDHCCIWFGKFPRYPVTSRNHIFHDANPSAATFLPRNKAILGDHHKALIDPPWNYQQKALKIGRGLTPPKKERKSLPTIHFQVRFVSFMEGDGVPLDFNEFKQLGCLGSSPWSTLWPSHLNAMLLPSCPLVRGCCFPLATHGENDQNISCIRWNYISTFGEHMQLILK